MHIVCLFVVGFIIYGIWDICISSVDSSTKARRNETRAQAEARLIKAWEESRGKKWTGPRHYS